MSLKTSIESQMREIQQRGGRIIVACSGGRDSMVLLWTLLETQEQLGFDLVEVAHVNYGLRGEESDGDQEMVAQFCVKSQVRFHLLDLRSETPPNAGIQNWARQARYQWFETLVRDGVDVIATAHHQSDLAETVVFRLSRGVGRYVSGMRVSSGFLWRPFLQVSKGWIDATQAGQKVPYREDSSNAKLVYSRNRIRHELMPRLNQLFPGAERRVAEAASDMDEILRFIDDCYPVKGLTSLPWSKIESLPEAVGRRVIANFLRQYVPEEGIRRGLLLRLWRKLKTSSNYSEEILGTEVVKVQSGQVLVQRKVASPSRQAQYQSLLCLGRKVLIPPQGKAFLVQDGTWVAKDNESRAPKTWVIGTT
ncbi:tRNA lysidine(34) synthetase TilS [Pseudobacteriovorax antillogorgiicola]|uniref:tRNA(Ile)-lysidine synthase n=1 Tax=Pseudobacteriovorax antillogorgiicola TaxID=1513793 RepID=A0A1Y6CJG9_9BACT|nr:tRNA lysidine(34) synthetase TilS [Pseudobacteriovorax antillogorgiicola]TCS46164.1 tRNA(Ile)-lysidine synthetase-like protein [Pseudobacteriovorax antillogorgiicola]SMF69916.1 tRNA(Ile)-lysidine synthetase, N-terminal domain-containing protein [Pseudobacteriovorax antillogorgiicola]